VGVTLISDTLLGSSSFSRYETLNWTGHVRAPAVSLWVMVKACAYFQGCEIIHSCFGAVTDQ